MADKYTQAEIDELGKKGHAFGPDDEGHYSYPIDDEEDLDNAIHAVGRGNADHDAIRKYIIGRADDMGLSDKIPDNWNKDGSLKDDGSSAKAPATAIRAEYRGIVETRVSPRREFELREVPNGTGGTNLRFTGFASVTGDEAAYEMEDWLGPWTESIGLSAFDKTLLEGADAAFLINHTGMTLARTKPGTLKLAAVKDGITSPVSGVTGLHSEALLDPQNMYVQAMRSAVERRDLDEMSFAFRVMRQEWNSDYTRRWINEVSLDKGDVSLVNYGANPSTGGTVALRQRLGPLATRGGTVDAGRLAAIVKRSRLFAVEFELRVGKVLSAANQAKLQEALDALHSTDDADIPGIVKALQAIDAALDAGQAAISAVLSVADPDGDKNDQEPALVPPGESKGLIVLPDATSAARAALERAKGRAA